jgi:O-antigen/teichoic acid export membrane protein
MPGVEQLELKDSTFKPALMLMSGRALAFTATFFVPVVLTRIFTQAEFGTYKQFFLLVSILYGIGQIGMAESLYYFLPSSVTGAGRYVANSVLTLAAVGLVVLATLGFAGRSISSWMGGAHLAPLAGLYLTLMLTSCGLEIVWITRKRYRLATISYASSDALRAVMLIAPALMFRSIEAVIIGGVVFCIARVAAMLLVLRHEFRGDLRPDTALLKQQFAYAIPFAFAVLVDVLQTNYHQLAVSLYFDKATLAIYAVGCLQIPIVDFMATPASSVMMVRMGEEIRDGRLKSLLPIWHDTTRKLALVFFPLVGVLVVNATALITTLFDKDKYAASVPIFMVWSLSILFASIQTDGVMRVFAQTRFLFVLNLFRLSLLVAVMHWFLTHFHLQGAVMVTLLGMAFAKTVALIRIRRLMHVGLSMLLPWEKIGRILLAAMISAVPVAVLNRSLTGPPWALLFIGGALYAFTYASLVLILRILTDSERQAIFARLVRWKRCVE